VVELAIHCGPIAGGYGCDMGELPAPPAESVTVFYALAAAAMALGIYVILSGRLPIRLGLLKKIWSKRATRLIGLSYVAWSFFAVWLGRDFALLSRHTVPGPTWLEMLFFPAIIANLALQWWAYTIDRRRTPPNVVANGRDA
jgi:hypothetical protein